jgi:flagellar biosynthesis/type III secretory pathway protein FliH
MAATITLQFGRNIGSVQTLAPAEIAKNTAAASDAKEIAGLKNKLESLCQAVNLAAKETESYGKRLFAAHREQIIRLAIQIASRILVRDVEQGQYQIERILTEAIATTPGGSILEIRMNPDDLKTYEEIVKNGSAEIDADIKLTADWSIGKAECVVITTEGLVECTMQEHLRQIEMALQTAQA